jgi:hypothetical protein
MCAVRGLAEDHPGKHITYRVHRDSIPFIELFDCGAAEIREHDHDHNRDEPPATTDRQMNAGYNTLEVRGRAPIPRWERYRSNIGASKCVLPQLRERERLAELGRAYSGAVVLAPFSSYRDREWNQRSWQELAALLERKAYRVVVVARDEARPLDKFACEKVVGAGHEELAGLLLNAAAVVGNDSGVAHMAGVMGCPTVVLCAQTTGKDIFGFYPSVRVLQAHAMTCSGCWWQAPYHSATCNPHCPALQTITPAEVVHEVDELVLPAWAGGRACVAAEKLGVLRDAVLKTNGLPGDVGEFGVWRGGSAKILDRFSSHGAIHLWDTFTGLPHDDKDEGDHKAGDFADTTEADVRAYLADTRCELHVGLFPETAVEGIRLRFAHVDMDLYTSTRSVIEYLRRVMVPGGLAVFDDYGWRLCPGVQQAVHEVFGADNWHRLSEYQCAVRF